MLLIHPVIQVIGILLILYTFFLGIQRTRSLHFGQKVSFPWKRHVLAGRIALSTVTFGMLVGLAMTRYHWEKNLMTMGHGKTGLLILLPLILIGMITGVLLNGRRKSAKILRVIHGVNNTVLLLLILNQVRTGLGVYRLFASGL